MDDMDIDNAISNEISHCLLSLRENILLRQVGSDYLIFDCLFNETSVISLLAFLILDACDSIPVSGSGLCFKLLSDSRLDSALIENDFNDTVRFLLAKGWIKSGDSGCR